MWRSVGVAVNQSWHGERQLCPALCRWSCLLEDKVILCGQGDGIVTQEEVSSLFDIWDYTLSLSAFKKNIMVNKSFKQN